MNSSTLLTVLAVAALVAIALVIVRAVQRRRYIGSLKELGWEFQNSPSLEITYGLNCPPFGLGFHRDVDDLISGRTSASVPFRVFEYGKERVAAVPLPASLPEVFISLPGQGRPGVNGSVRSFGPWQVTSVDPAFADAVLGVAAPYLDELAAAGPVNLSVDGAALVASGAPKEAEQLRPFVESLGRLGGALAGAGLQARFPGPALPAELSLYRHPDWIYRPSDDRFLAQVVISQGGYGHSSRDVVLGELAGGIRMIALTHEWKTDRTVMTTDAEGRVSSHTETDHHSEPVLEFHLPWAFGTLSLNGAWTGGKVRFESSEFNDRFTVRCENAKFAMDVFHPRQLEFIQRSDPLPFAIETGRMRLDARAADAATIEWAAAFVVTFFAGVPRFVWVDLGHAAPPINPELAGF